MIAIVSPILDAAAELAISASIFIVPLIAFWISHRKKSTPHSPLARVFTICCILGVLATVSYFLLVYFGAMTAAITVKILLSIFLPALSILLWIHPFDIFSITHLIEWQNPQTDVQQQGNVLDFTLQNIGDGVVVTNKVGNVLLWNPAAQAIFGMSKIDGSIGEAEMDWGLYYADTHTPIPHDKTPIGRALEGEGVDQYEIFVRNRKSPSGFWISKTARPIRSPYGKIIGAVAIFTDITERKKQEEQIRHYMLEIEDLYNNAPTGYHSLDKDGRYIKINDTELNWFGYSRDEMIGEHVTKFMTDGSKDLFVKTFPIFISKGELRDIRIEFVRKDGSVFPVVINAIAVRNSDGGILHSRSVVLDLSEAYAANNALIESENRFHTLAALSPVGIFQSDPDGKCTYVNEKWMEITGLSMEEAKGDGWTIALHSEDITDVASDWLESVSQGTEFHSEYRFCRKDGKITWVIGQAATERDRNGNILGYVGTITDMTEQRKAREALEAYAMELKRSNEDLENFTHVASHDLTEPLRMVSYYVQILRDKYLGKIDKDADQYITLAMDGAERMFTLINDLLQFSRVTRQTSDEECDSAETSCIVLDDLKKIIDASCAEFEVDYLPVIQMSPMQVSQIFQNLITNSIKYKKKDVPPKIHISADMDENKTWTISVADNGIGIDRTDFNKLFILFSRLHTKDEYEGNGCGLAICKKIVERNGGKIWVESEVGVGTTIFFTIHTKKKSIDEQGIKTEKENNITGKNA